MLLGHAFDACTRLYDRLRSVQNASEGSDKVNLAFLPVVFRRVFERVICITRTKALLPNLVYAIKRALCNRPRLLLSPSEAVATTSILLRPDGNGLRRRLERRPSC
jgi:hypothetical protein